MSRVFVYLNVFLLGYSSGFIRLSYPECGQHELLDECYQECDFDSCPIMYGPVTPCPKPASCPQPVCKCIVNYKRAQNGTCIPVEECPPFDCNHSPNEEYHACPPYCPSDDCKYASSGRQCAFVGFLLTNFCTPACRCTEGHWRKNGTCVPKEQC